MAECGQKPTFEQVAEYGHEQLFSALYQMTSTTSPRNKMRTHRGYLHEVRIDEEGLEGCIALGPAGDGARRLLGKSTCVWVFWARCHFDAMNIYCDFLDRETYESGVSWDREEYPRAWYAEQEAHLITVCSQASGGTDWL